MRRLQRFLAPFLIVSLACTAAPTNNSADSKGAAEDPADATASLPFDGETLVFPPTPTRRERRDLPPRFKDAVEKDEVVPLEVSWPKLDGDGKFEFAGQSFTIRMTRKMKHGKKAPLTVTPSVKGKARWSSDWSVEFRADEPFDPDTVYTAKLGELTDTDGGTLPAWTGKFQADPHIWLGGKLLTYLPRPGKPKVVTTRPYDGSKVGSRPKLEILFDQKVKPADVENLIRLTETKSKKKAEIKLSHPKRDVFDGSDVDRGHMIVVEPSSPLKGGRSYRLAARDKGAKWADAEMLDVNIASALAFKKVDCGYRSEGCKWTGSKSTLETQNREFSIRFNNTLDHTVKFKKALTVDPPVRNLSIYADRWSSDGRLSISGAFEPSTEYTVKLMHARDTYGSMLLRPIEFTIKTAPLVASASMADGMQILDAERSRAYTVTTRNAKNATLRFWKIDETDKAWREANRQVSNREKPAADPTVELEIKPRSGLNKNVKTKVDLLDKLEPGHAYLAQLELGDAAFKAPKPKYESWSWAGKPHLALLVVSGDEAMAVHARSASDKTIVYVSSVDGGKPVAGAKIFLDNKRVAGVKTDKNGHAVLDLSHDDARHKVMRVEAGSRTAMLPLGDRFVTERDLAPELAAGAVGDLDKVRALVISDRGVYRPGATIHFKAMMRRPAGAELTPLAYVPARLEVIDPNGKSVYDEVSVATDVGTVNGSWTTPEGAEIGRHQIRVRSGLDNSLLASTQVQVAEFEPPRFKVDVDATAKGTKLTADVEGRYLFGAAMNGANTHWTLRRKQAPMPNGPLPARGLTFRRWSYRSSSWMRNGYGTLDEAGKLTVSPTLELEANAGPQKFTIEAEVTDSSHRSIAGRDSVVVHPAEHYAGVKIEGWSADMGKPLPLELGVINTKGESVEGKTIEAKMFHREWKRTKKAGPGGSVRVRWHEVRTAAGKCTAKSKLSATSCDLVPSKRGSYDVEVYVNGKLGGVENIWVWGGGSGSVPPQPGNEVNLIADKRSYAAGDEAKLVVHNPFENATAIFTVEQGSVIKTETKAVSAGPVEYGVKIRPEYAPRVHATVTLLPIGATGDAIAEWKFGAVRLPVELDGVSLDVAVTSDRPNYQPRETAKIKVAVSSAGKAVANADVALAVVDEGVLRLTNFRVADPVAALRPGAGLRFGIADTRQGLAQMLERSHTAGDGDDGEGNSSLVSTRKNFVRTALWSPDLRTNDAGEVEVELELPDNLTEFRMMAVVLDDVGRGGKVENSFEVRMPLMIIPAVPRFALAGDQFEAAVMVHNGEDKAVTATVSLGEESQEVELKARGRKRVSFTQTVREPGDKTFVFEVKDGAGEVRDRVESVIPIQVAGIDQSPRLAGSFVGVQEILLEVPEGVRTDLKKDAFINVTVGHDIWPELGSRLEYLVDYPHGCVEQTTSSTLPLLAARDILPRLGFFRFTTEEIDERATAGIKRLASMKTPSGGLAYWPGGSHPDLYGTAYAMRAVALAKKQGIEVPGLAEGMAKYLEERLVNSPDSETRYVETKAAVALALAEADALPESTADMLMDSVEKQGVFGIATMALAISSLEGHDDQVKELLDKVEAGFDDTGALVKKGSSDQFYYYGSNTRTKAQAALALTRLRPQSKALPGMLEDLVRATRSYTTQSTAFGLLALRERVITSAENKGKLTVRLDGNPLVPELKETLEMGGGAIQVAIPLADVAGRQGLLRLESSSDVAVSFLVRSRWRQPLAEKGALAGTSSEHGPEVYRVFTDPKGNAVDMGAIEPGTLVRVAVLARIPEGLDRDRRGYLAITDRIPAGFEPIQPDLWTVARPAEVSSEHPLYHLMRYSSNSASHVELRDDRVHMYFDRFWGEYITGTYTMRATTPGSYAIPPSIAELMYEPDSTGYSRFAETTVVPK